MEHLKISCNFNSKVLLKEYYVCELSFTLIITNTEDIFCILCICINLFTNKIDSINRYMNSIYVFRIC